MDTNALTRVKQAESRVWLPDGSSHDFKTKAIEKALSAYDEDLTLGQHQHTGDWCVFLKPRKNPFGLNEPYPVLGIGRELPHVDDVMKKLHKYDSHRRGLKILAEINDPAEKALKAMRDSSSDAAGIVAEAQESYLHDQGKTPYSKIYRPIKQTGVKIP